jgi:hypothetical protein
MELELSSRWTFYHKFVLPVVITGAMLAGTWFARVHPDSPRLHGPGGTPPDQVWLMVLGVTVIVIVAVGLMVAPLKRVVLSGDELVISNFRSEIRVPLTNVAEIGKLSLTDPKRHTIRFEESTEFGDKVTFMVPRRWGLNKWVESEDVQELRRAWEAAREKRR